MADNILCNLTQASVSMVEFRRNGISETPNFCSLFSTPSFALRFFRDFHRFCPLLPDLVLQLDSGERINVHRLLFYCCSAYCRTRLSTEPPAAILRVPHIDYESLKVVVDFIYSGGVLTSIPFKNINRIKFAATLLDINELAVICDSLLNFNNEICNNCTDNESNIRLDSFEQEFDKHLNHPHRNLNVECNTNGKIGSGTATKSNSSKDNTEAFSIALSEEKRMNDEQVKICKADSVKDSAPNLDRFADRSSSNVHAVPANSTESSLKIKEEAIIDNSDILMSRSSKRQKSDEAPVGRDISWPKTQLRADLPQEVSVISQGDYIFLMNYNKEDLMLSEKYIYLSKLCFCNSLLLSYKLYSFADEMAPASCLQRQSLILFSLDLPSHCSTERYALVALLDFSDMASMLGYCKRALLRFVNMCFMLPDRYLTADLSLDSVSCLKKPSGFKSSFKKEVIVSSSECFKALAEYSRLSEKDNELPLVLLTCSGVFTINSA